MEIEVIKKIKRHWPAVLLAVVFGFLTVLPFLYFQISMGDEYRGVLNQVIDDELFYMARIKDVMDGHATLGNAYLLEHKNQPPQQLFLPEWLLAQPLKLLNFDIVQSRLFYSFILPAIALLLTYLALYNIYPYRFWAVLFSAFLFFGLYLFKFTRPVIPQFVFLFWLSQFILLWQLIKNPSDKTFKLLNILNFSLLFYIYPFYWTFYTALLAILVFLYFFKDRFLSKQFIKILIGGLLIGSVYFYITFLASQLPEYQETLTRIQLVFSRSPSEIKTVLPAFLVLILVVVLYRLKAMKINREILFFVAGIISIFLVTNQNIITGQKFEFGHYRMPAMFFLTFAVYYLLVPYETARARSVTLFRMGWGHFLKSLNFKFRYLIAFLIIIASAYGIYGYAQRVFKISESDIYIQKYRVVFDWFDENTPKDSVVYANEEISSLVPVYTANNVFYYRYANLFIMDDEEVESRFILNNFFEKFDRDFVVENERAIWGVRYVDRYADAIQANKWRKFLGLGFKSEERLPEESINKVIAKVQEIQKYSFSDSFRKYRVDYFVWDKNKDPEWRLDDSKVLKAVFENEGFVIYKLEPF